MSQSAEPRPAVDRTPDPALAALIDLLTARLQAGEPLDLEACLRAHPQYADQLRELLPAALALVEAGQSAGGSFAALATASPQTGLRRLGDYRLVRQVGRGGM